MLGLDVHPARAIDGKGRYRTDGRVRRAVSGGVVRGQRALQLCPNVSFQGIRFGARHIEQVDARFRMATGDCDKQFDANAAAFRGGHTHDIETWVDVRGHFSTNRRHPIEVDRHVQSLATSGRGINRVARELEECIRESIDSETCLAHAWASPEARTAAAILRQRAPSPGTFLRRILLVRF